MIGLLSALVQQLAFRLLCLIKYHLFFVFKRGLLIPKNLKPLKNVLDLFAGGGRAPLETP